MSRTRLAQLERYLAQAELNPEDNRLYIEDLKVSIKHAKLNPQMTYHEFAVKQGFNSNANDQFDTQ